MDKLYLQRNVFFMLFALFLILGASLFFICEKGEIVLFINGNWTSETGDWFFKNITFLGDGLLILVFAVVFLFVKYRYSIVVAVSGIFQLLFVHINKKVLFPGLPRPKLYLEKYDLRFVEGVDVHSYNTFPSGHTTTAFALFFLVSIFFPRFKVLQVCCFMIALFVGISRIYLLQHFFADVYFGAFFGVTSALLAVVVTNKVLKKTVFEQKVKLTSRR